ncbi:MAG: energy-coupling factor transporter transmembrane component T [Thermacetogeniaceae bacterium]
MLEHLYYEDKEVLLQALHSAAALGYLSVFSILPLIFTHPLYLLGVFLISALAIAAADALEKWEAYLKAGLWMAVTVMVINSLVYHSGKTVLWRSPNIPIVGSISICLEAVCYGAAMGIRLLAVLTVFCLASAVVHPDKFLSLFSRFAYKSALVVSLATRTLPTAARELANAREMLQLRGVNFASGNILERLKKYSWLFDILLVSSLEGALQTAEAMQARAFGSGPRSCYRRELWRPRDLLCLAAAFLTLALSCYARLKGYGCYSYYPQLGALVPDHLSLYLLAGILASLASPLLLSWGWKHWPYLRSKI